MSKTLELRKTIEEKIINIVDPLSKIEQLIAYKYLRGIGCSMEGIDYEIDRLLREESKIT